MDILYTSGYRYEGDFSYEPVSYDADRKPETDDDYEVYGFAECEIRGK